MPKKRDWSAASRQVSTQYGQNSNKKMSSIGRISIDAKGPKNPLVTVQESAEEERPKRIAAIKRF